MKLDQITQIKQTAEQTEVNLALAQGYKLIKIFSGKLTTEHGEFVQPIYVLGLERIEPEQKG